MAVEYLLLLGVVAAIVLGGYSYWVGHGRDEGRVYFENTVPEIYGRAPVLRDSDAYVYP